MNRGTGSTGLKALNLPKPLAKMAYDSLRESIINGRMKAGEIYNEIALAKELEISRTPVREALLELAAHGLVTFLPRKGVVVNHFTEEDAREIFQVRKALELFCVERIAGAGVDKDLGPIIEALERQARSLAQGDMRAFITGDRDFHTSFTDMVGNQRLAGILSNMRDQIQIMALEALGRPGRAAEVMEEHGRILEAVKRGDVRKAREAITVHLNNSREAVLAGRTEPEGE